MASSIIGALRVTLGIDTAKFTEGLNAAQKELQKGGKRLQDIGGTIAGVGAKLSLAVTAPFAALAISSVQAAKETAAALGQVQAALDHMDGASKRSVAQLQAQSSALQDLSTFDDDDIMRKVTANLLTFGNVSGDVFDKAQVAIVDLSARLGQDLQSSAIQVGKALNDPVKGIKALSRVGVSFTQQQKDQIQAMTEAGNVAGAQKIILGELTKEFGGSAKALRDATPSAEMDTQWRNFQETVGAIVQKMLPPLTSFLTTLLAGFNQLSPGMQTFAVGAAAVAAALGPVLIGIGGFISLIGSLLPALAPIAEIVGEGGLAEWLGALAGAFGPPGLAIAAFVAVLVTGWDKVGPVLSNLWTSLQGTLGPAVAQLVQTLASTLSALWDGPLGGGIRAVVGFLTDLAAALLKVFGPVAVQLLTAFVQVVTGAVGLIGNVITALAKLLTGDFSGAWAALKAGATAAVTGLLAALDTIAPGARKALVDLYNGVKEWLQNKLGAVFDWVGDKIATVKGWFFGLYDAVVGHSYIPDMVDGIAAQFARLDSVMVEPVRKSTESAKTAFRDLASFARDQLAQIDPAAAIDADLASTVDKLNKAAKAGDITPQQLHDLTFFDTVQAAQKKDALNPAPEAPDIGADMSLEHAAGPLQSLPTDLAAAIHKQAPQLSDGVRQFIGDGVRAAMSGDLKGFATSWVKEWASKGLESALDKLGGLIKQLFSNIGASGSGGSGSGILSFLTSAAHIAASAFTGSGGGMTPVDASSIAGPFDFGGVGQIDTSGIANIPAFANGGSFKVGGRGGVDRNLTMFKATKGEIVDVYKAGGARRSSGDIHLGGLNFSVDARGAGPREIDQLRAEVAQFKAEIPGRIVGTVADARKRGLLRA